MAIALLGGIIVFSLVFYSYQKLQATTKKLVFSRKIVETSSNLNYLASNYLLKPTKRMKIQWDVSCVTFKQQINQLKKENLSPEEIKIVEKITREFQSAEYYFSSFKFLEDSQFEIDFKYENSGEFISLNLHQMVHLVLYLESVFRNQFIIIQKKFIFWFLMTSVVFFSIFSWFVYRLFRDIQYRDKIQKELKEANQKLRIVDRLVEFTGDGVYRYRYKDGKILFANQGFVNILELNCKPEQVIGKKLEEVMEYLEEPGKIRGLIEAQGSIRNYPYHFKTKAGEEKWILHNSFLIEEEAGEKVLESIVTDITEKRKSEDKIKQSESKFRTIFEKAQTAIFVVDPETGKILDCNRRAEELMTLPREQLIGIHQSQLQPQGKEELYTKRFCQDLKKSKADYQGEIEDSRGVIKPVWISADLFNFGGKDLLVGFFTDLSERINYEKKEKEALAASVRAEAEHRKAKELEKAYNELKNIQEKLIRSEQLAALGRLSGIVAHDLRNPLGVIRNSIYIIKSKLKDATDPKVKKYLKILDEEIETADTIIEDVLSFTRLKNIKFSPFNLNQEIEKILEKIEIPKNIKLTKKIDKNISKIKGDKDQLKRVFINLINNAIEAMPDGGKLTITTKAKDDRVLIKISDSGIGIGAEDQGKIFEPMFSTKIHGTGLGLSACKNIIEVHQGEIEIESKRGEGTTVFLKIPLL